MNRFKEFTARAWFFPLALLAVCFITYGYQLTRMGFYWDDWEIVYLDHLRDPRVYYTYFLYARPLTGWLYILLSPVLAMDPVRWQAFNILARWLSLWAFWWALAGIWPSRRQEAGWVALLLAVYPGFTQHSVALTYSRHFVCYALYAASLGLTVHGIRQPLRNGLYTGLALAFSLIHLLTLEYFFGLELLRPFFVWFVIRVPGESFWRTFWNTVRRWAPYALVLAVFLVLRFGVYRAISPNPGANDPVLIQRLLASPLSEGLRFTTLIAQDFIYLNLLAWVNTILPKLVEIKAKANLVAWAAGLVSSALLVFFFIKGGLAEKRDDAPNDNFIPQCLLTGALGVLLGGMPVWLTGRQVIGGPWADRFALGPMFGASLLLVGLVEWFARRRVPKAVLLGIVFALAMSSQMQTVNKYRLSWENQKAFYWQLAWRAPGLAPGTSLIGPAMPFALVNDLHIGFALNTIYAPNSRSMEAPIWFFRAGGMQDGLVPDLKAGYPIDYRYLTVHFQGSTSRSLVVSFNNGADCVRVSKPDEVDRPGVSSDERKLARLSSIDLITPNPSPPVSPPAGIFGAEPAHDWCYFFEKADLARQRGDWTEVLRLKTEADQRNLKPHNALEASPFLEASAQTGNWEAARQVTLDDFQHSSASRLTWCWAWEKLERSASSDQKVLGLIAGVKKSLNCPLPVESDHGQTL